MKLIYTATCLLLISVFSSGFNNPDHPKKHHGNYKLFKIDRSRDQDVVMYDVNLDDQDALNTEMPIKIYWKRNTQDGHYESLTGIQRKFGYGLKFNNVSDDMADFQFVSNIDRIFELRKSSNNQYKVYTVSHGKKVEVKSLYIFFEDDSFWFPTVSKIELSGIDRSNGDVIVETIIP